MKRDILGFLLVRRLRQSPAFAFLVAALLCGVFAGGFTGMYIPQSDGSYVHELAKLVSSNAAGRMPSVRTVLTSAASTFGWIAAAGLLGAIPGRALWMALLLAVRGFFVLCCGSSVGAVRFVGCIHCVCFHWHLRGLLAAGNAADWHGCIGNWDAARQVFCCVEAIRRTVAAVYAAVVCIYALETAACSGSARRVLTDKREKLCMFALLRNIHSFFIFYISKRVNCWSARLSIMRQCLRA